MLTPPLSMTAASLLPLLALHGVASTTAEIPPVVVVPNTPQLPFEKYTLPNGLEVILHEDHRMPEVAVDVWYKVGSKDEVAGRTGFAHLFEHMMFQGSKHVARGQALRVPPEGRRLERQRLDHAPTARTTSRSCRRTSSSWRCGWRATAWASCSTGPASSETLDNQRDVVKNERRQRFENRPMGLRRARPCSRRSTRPSTRTTTRSSGRWRTCRPRRSTT